MYNYSITYKDLSVAGTFFKGCHIKADDMIQCCLAFNKLFPAGMIYGVKLND